MAEHPLQLVEGEVGGLLLVEAPSVGMREGGDEHRAKHRVVAVPVFGVRRGVRDRPHRPPVESTPEGNHGLPTRCPASELDRRLHRLGPRVGKAEHFDPWWGDVRQPLGDLDDRLVAEDAPRVSHPPHLLHGGCGHVRVVVSEVGHRGPAGEIGPPVSGTVVDPEACGALDHDVGVKAENRSHGRVMTGDEVGHGRHGTQKSEGGRRKAEGKDARGPTRQQLRTVRELDSALSFDNFADHPGGVAETGERLRTPCSAPGQPPARNPKPMLKATASRIGHRSHLLEDMEHPRHLPGSLMEDRPRPLGEDPCQVGGDSATGHVGEAVDPSGRRGVEHRRRVDDRRVEEHLRPGAVISGEGPIEVALADDGSHQRETVAPQVGAGDTNDDIAGADGRSRRCDRPVPPPQAPLRPGRPGRMPSPRGARLSHLRAAARQPGRIPQPPRPPRPGRGRARADPPPCSRPAREGSPRLQRGRRRTWRPGRPEAHPSDRCAAPVRAWFPRRRW